MVRSLLNTRLSERIGLSQRIGLSDQLQRKAGGFFDLSTHGNVILVIAAVMSVMVVGLLIYVGFRVAPVMFLNKRETIRKVLLKRMIQMRQPNSYSHRVNAVLHARQARIHFLEMVKMVNPRTLWTMDPRKQAGGLQRVKNSKNKRLLHRFLLPNNHQLIQLLYMPMDGRGNPDWRAERGIRHRVSYFQYETFCET